MWATRVRSGSITRGAAALATAALVAACSTDSVGGPAPPRSSYLSVAFAELAQGYRSIVVAPPPGGFTVISGMSTAGRAAPIVPSECTYATATQSFSCPTYALSGLTITQSFTLHDAAGKAQAQADQATTASVKVVASIRGTLPLDAILALVLGPVTVTRREEMTLSGLLSGTHTLTGVATDTTTGPSPSSTLSQQYTTVSRETTVDLVFPRVTPGAAIGLPLPLSGTIRIDYTSTMSPENERPWTSRQLITFDGTTTVTSTFASAAGTRTCKQDFRSFLLAQLALCTFTATP